MNSNLDQDANAILMASVVGIRMVLLGREHADKYYTAGGSKALMWASKSFLIGPKAAGGLSAVVVYRRSLQRASGSRARVTL